MSLIKKSFCGCLFALMPFLVVLGADSSSISEKIASQDGVDVVVFSYNRPTQLFAFLESFFLHAAGHHDLTVVCRVDNDRFLQSYQQVQKAFPQVKFCLQSRTPANDFHRLTMEAAFSPSSGAKYVMFAVDDIVLTRSFDFRECCRALEAYDGYGFFLRLGTNITRCYMLSIPSPVPPHADLEGKFLQWKFSDGIGDWGYPQNTDMTVYRKSDIQPMLASLNFTSPNTMEGQWSYLPPTRPHGLCFARSMMVNLPYNKVNRSTNRYNEKKEMSPEEFLQLFEQGMKIDVEKLRDLQNDAPHFDYDLPLTRRR